MSIEKVAKFYKVSFEQFLGDWQAVYPEDDEAVVRYTTISGCRKELPQARQAMISFSPLQ